MHRQEGNDGSWWTSSPRDLSEKELCDWAGEVGRHALADGVFVCLYGELGTGKSTLVRAACRGIGMTGHIPSPTFTLVNRHARADGSVLLHVDLYRLKSQAELTDIGWFDLVGSGHAVFVEWADRAGRHLPADRWEIRLSFSTDPEVRIVETRSVGEVPSLPDPVSRERSC